MKPKKLNKKIAIVGCGYVGTAMYRFFHDHYNVFPYDTDPKHPSVTMDEVNECDVSLVCVPTPPRENGECNTDIVEEVIDWIETDLIIIKSTVEIGTTKKLVEKTGKNIIFSPEYCGESSYWSPYAFDTEVVETPFFIFGGDKNNTSNAVNLYMPVAGPTKKYVQTDSNTAEIVKYMENTFFLTKVVFCYEIERICKKLGIDYNIARELWLLDPRINPMHTAVFDSNRGDLVGGGHCLPKDISALVAYAEKNGYDPQLLKSVIDSNSRIAKLRKESP